MIKRTHALATDLVSSVRVRCVQLASGCSCAGRGLEPPPGKSRTNRLNLLTLGRQNAVRQWLYDRQMATLGPDVRTESGTAFLSFISVGTRG